MGKCLSKESVEKPGQALPRPKVGRPTRAKNLGKESETAPSENRNTATLNTNAGSDTSKSAVSEKSVKSHPENLSEYPMPIDRSDHSASNGMNTTQSSSGKLMQSSSILGLDKMIDERKSGGDLKNNIVHMEVPFGKPIEEVYDGVHDGPVLGSGISGLVRLCTHMATGAKYAVKCLDLGLVETEEGLQQLREEIAIMCQLDHPNIVRLEEVYESHSEIYLVQELCVGGELFDRLDEQPDYHYTESQCARLVKQMLCSVRYCHSKGIIHRDLKLENFLFSTASADSELKMIDFGLSKHFKYGEVQHEAVGTPYTVAPEVIRGTYDERCDVWAIGVITYLLLSGDPPFGGCGGPESLMRVRANILGGRFKFEPIEVWQHVSEDAKDFIRELLVTDPNCRPTARQCQKSKWLRDWSNRDKMGDSLNANVVKALVNFKELSDMRKLLCEVLSFTLLPDQITDLRREFEKLDIDGSGEISLRELKQVLMQGAGSGTLGALTEEEIEDIFNAMRVRKSETRIHWHEFIAAGLSQCKVDDRNLRLAFERLDADHKGYVTFDNIMDLMGKDAESEDEMRKMWLSSMQSCSCSGVHVTYEDFLVLMKGQTLQKTQNIKQTLILPLPGDLGVLHEVSDSNEDFEESSEAPPSPQSGTIFQNTSTRKMINQSLTAGSRTTTTQVFVDEPVSMDSDDDRLDQLISESADIVMRFSPIETNLTPPQSPVRSSIDYVSPNLNANDFQVSPPIHAALSKSLQPIPLTQDFSRRRSRSVDDSDQFNENEADDSKINPDIRRAMLLPEHTHDKVEIEKALVNDKLTPLVVNRKLYRAHRQMRLAVLEASKRFEDQQLERTRAELQAKHDAEKKHRFGAGLVMRRGHRKELSSDAIRTMMKERQKLHQTLVDSAARRGGRGKRARKKTISDMSGMLLSISDDISANNPSIPPLIEKTSVQSDTLPSEMVLSKLNDMHKPEPTVPGKFRITQDPFKEMGETMRHVLDYANVMSVNTIEESIDSKSGNMHRINSSMKVSSSDGELNLMA